MKPACSVTGRGAQGALKIGKSSVVANASNQMIVKFMALET